MPCYGPLTAYQPKASSGQTRLVFKKADSETGIAITIPCGKCIGCKLEHSRQWAMRCMHEKRMHSESCFLTLTYDNAHLPAGGTLVKRDLQLFMKRVRKQFGEGVRFFACGEYGDKTQRPHYHVLLLNKDFADRKPVTTRSEHPYYTSVLLSKLWTDGGHTIGNVDFESAAYVARYCTKKISGPGAEKHYGQREKEFLLMSRRPGIGTTYLQKYEREIYAHDNVIVNGVPSSIPRFYDTKFASLSDTNAEKLEQLKLKRRRKLNRKDKGTTRLRVREVVQIAKLGLKKRTL